MDSLLSKLIAVPHNGAHNGPLHLFFSLEWVTLSNKYLLILYKKPLAPGFLISSTYPKLSILRLN